MLQRGIREESFAAGRLAIATRPGQSLGPAGRRPGLSPHGKDITRLSDRLHRLLRRVGPGLITGAADDDPSGVVTYSAAGAAYGMVLGWTVVLCLPFMVAVQEISARIGRVTGGGLAVTLHRHTPAWFAAAVVLLLAFANILNLGADVAAMADVAHLMFGGWAALWAISIAVFCAACAIWIDYRRYVRVLKFLTLPLLAYFVLLLVVKTDWRAALLGVVLPSVPVGREAWMMVVAVFGTTISPYLFFWQAAEEAEDEWLEPDPRPLRDHPGDARAELNRIGFDTWTGMIYSNLVALAIIWAAATSLHAHGITVIETARQAALALRPIAGDYAMDLFGFGIIGTGLLAVPVLAGSVAYSVAEIRGWPVGLNHKARQARSFYGVLVASAFLGLLLALSPIDPVQALVGSAVVNGVIAVPLIVIITVLGTRASVMGSLVLPRWLVLGGLATAVLMGAATAAMLLL